MRSAWLANPRLRRLGLTLFDQGVVSAGAFIVQVILARLLLPVEYGVFTLVFGALLSLQLVNAAIIFFPLAVETAAATPEERPSLLGAAMILLLGVSALLSLILVAGLAGFGQSGLILPALAFFLAWQAQEGLRRKLFGGFRHGEAVAGDSVTYLGQAVLTLALGLTGALSIAGVFYAMAFSAALGAALHARALRFAWPSAPRLVAVARSFWRLGGTASLSNAGLSQIRMMALPWALALHAGPAATAGFQAMMNIINLSNPLIIGLGNIIPQAVADGRAKGPAQGWRVARGYGLMAAPAILLYSGLVLAFPDLVLHIFYGAGSDYTELALPLRLLILAGLFSFAVEVIIAFLYGAAMVGRAATVNLWGTVALVVMAVPLVNVLGLLGAAAALLASNALRLVLAYMTLSRHAHLPLAVPLPPPAR